MDTYGMMAGVQMWGWDSAAGAWVKVLVNAAGKLIIDPTEIFEDPPTDGEAGKAATSNWSHDHEADASAHHVKYTDAEALAAAVQAGALTDGVTLAPTHDAVYDALVAKLATVSVAQPARAKDTIYQNGAKLLLVVIDFTVTAAGEFQIKIGAASPPATIVSSGFALYTHSKTVTFLVPANYYYQLDETMATITVVKWTEYTLF